jgi:hypothetical protein
VFKVASDSKAHYKQTAIIKLLMAGEEMVVNIHKCLKNFYGDCTVNRSTVGYWVKCATISERGNSNLDDEPCSSCPTSIFWDIKKVILINIMDKRTTINSEAYVTTLQRL